MYSPVPAALILAAILLPMHAGAVQYNNMTHTGDKTVSIAGCGNHEVKNNYIDGNLYIDFVGQTLPCGVDILIEDNYVLNSLVIRAQNNKIDNGDLRLRANSNDQVGDSMVLRVENNIIHQKPAAPGQNFNIIIEMNNNGSTSQNRQFNEVVGQNLEAHVNGNWVKDTLDLKIITNVTATDFKVRTNGNTVNSLLSSIEGNRACNETDIDFLDNTIDTHFQPRIIGNRSCKGFGVNITQNKVPYLPPRKLDPTVTDNHSATGQLTLRFDQNIADDIDLRFEKNGAGLGGAIGINSNIANVKQEYRVNDNQTDNQLAIQIQNNAQPPNPYEVKNNIACTGMPLLNVQPAPDQTGTMAGCTRQMGSDTDGDGLTDDFEKMIGTDFQGQDAWDTDHDGLADGWTDYNRNGSWDPGEPMGELGDVNNQHAGGGPNIGSVDSLFSGVNKSPNLLCKDIYVEADFMSANPNDATDVDHKMTAAAINLFKPSMRRHGIFLYVDTGWSTGLAASDAPGGGELIPHVSKLWYYNKNKFDFYNLKNGEVLQDYDGDGIMEPRRFSNSRKGSFHYLVVGHDFTGKTNTSDKSVGFAEPLDWKVKGQTIDTEGDDFFIADHPLQPFSGNAYNAALAYTLCHELGHNLGLGLSSGLHDKAKNVYWSCMSYNNAVKFSLVDYSDGRAGTPDDSNDWNNMKVRTSISTWWNPRWVRDPTK